jgi:hypothetical protein
MGNILIHPALYDWEPLVTINGLAFHAPNGVDRKQALDIYCQIENWLEILAASWGEVALIYNGSTQGLRKFAMANSTPKPSEPVNPKINPITLRPDDDYQRVTEFLLEHWQDGKSVCVVSQIDNRCLFQNDKLLPARAIIQPSEWIGQNYLWYWRDSMDDYAALRELLTREVYIPKFEYQLRRPDGSMARYQTDYYTANYLGVPVRVGVSGLADWELIND